MLLAPFTTAALGCLVAFPLTALLLLLTFGLIWAILVAILLGTSSLWQRSPLLRVSLAFIGIPTAIVASIFLLLTPNPDPQDKMHKLHICDSWPFSTDVVWGGAPYSPAIRFAEAPPISLVNINTADAFLLETLPGIGLGKAKNIIDYRNKYGPFLRKEDLMYVEGIGEATYEALEDMITI